MYEDINPPKDFEYAASYCGAKTAILLNQLSGVPIDNAIIMILCSEFGALLRQEYTKAWYSPEYWNYVAVCKDFNLSSAPPREFYDYSELRNITEKFRKKFFEEPDYIKSDNEITAK